MLIPPQAALVLATALAAARPVPIPPQGGREVVTLGPGQWRRHEIALEAGQFLQGTLHQRGVDVKLRLVAPDGSAIEDDVDSSEGPTGMEPVSMLARVAGVHAIEVWAPYDVPEPGAYEIETAAPRLPTPRDRQRLEAERLMAAGGRVMPGRSTSAAYRRVGLSQETAALAIERYGAAIPLWAALGEPCWQAEAEQCLGITETWDGYEGRFAASEEHLHQALDHWQECGDAHKFAETVLFTGRLFVATSRFREAAEAYEFGADLPDLHPVLRAQFMVQLAKTYGLLGDTERAVRHGEAILPYLRDQRFVQGTAVVLTYLANAYYRRGELQRASEQAGEALALRRQVNPEWRTMQGEGLMESLLTLADIYDALGEPEIALGYLEEGMEPGVPRIPSS
jgi:tetratricopeptide (TPR) repeat protein